MKQADSAPGTNLDGALYRELVNDMSEGLCVSSPDFIFQMSNPALDAIFGVPHGGLIGRSLLDFLHEADRAAVASQQTRRSTGAPGQYQLRIRRADGTTRMLDVRARPRLDAAGAYCGSVALVTDITEQLAAEAAQEAAEDTERQAQLRSAELETIQRTAATYAHEVNNPLTGIVANAQMLIEQEAPGSERWQMLREVLEAARQIGSVINAMQTLNRPSYRDYHKREIIDLAESEE